MNRPVRVAHVVALVVIGVSVLAVPALADCPELVGHWPWGPAYAVAVSGDLAYVGSGSGLLIADVSDPSTPLAVGELALRDISVAVTVSGDYAYVATESSGLLVIDVSAPSAPVEVGFYDTSRRSEDVAVSGGYAFIADDLGLRVVDVSTPSAPVEIGFYGTQNPALSVAVSGSYAYVADNDPDSGEGGLRVVDVSTPSAPVEVGFYDMQNSASSVAVSGSYAYVVGWDGFSVIDVSTPSAPVDVGFIGWGLWGHGRDVALSGAFAYVTHIFCEFGCTGTLLVIDVSTPAAPVETGFLQLPDPASTVAASDGHAYLTSENLGLLVIDVSTPSDPVQVGFYGTPGPSLDVAVSESYAYVAAGGLRVLDTSIPSAPFEVGSLDGPVGSVSVNGDHTYLASLSGLRIIDVSAPWDPVEVGFVDTPGDAADVAVSGGYAYVAYTIYSAEERGGLVVIDVSTPSAPVAVGSMTLPARTRAIEVAVSGSFAYVTAWSSLTGESTLRVIDVSSPSAPVEVAVLELPWAWGVDVSGSHAYVTSYSSGGAGLVVIDVSTPPAPVEVGFVEMPGVGYDVAASGDFAYVRYWNNDPVENGLRVIDVNVPSAPREVGSYITAPSSLSSGGGISVSGGYVYVASGVAGLYSFNECTRGSAPDARECFIPAAAVAAGAQGAFFQTDVEINNTGSEEAEVHFQWLPRGQDNSEPVESEPIVLAPGQSLRWENVLTELFGLSPDSLGALKLVASTESVIGMSRTYNVPGAKAAGTFGQGLPAIRATEMIKRTQPRRIIFLSEDFVSRANVGCVNGSSEPVAINIELFNSEGESLEVKTMDLEPYFNNQINRIFSGHGWVNGYVDVWADNLDALYYCYGSMLDNSTSDPTTILPQVPSADMTFIPAAALAAGLEGSFFRTDVDLNNVGATDLTYQLLWLPRGADNSDPVSSDPFSLAPGAGVRYANVLNEVFGLEPDQIGALGLEASGIDLLAMSRTYNLPSAKVAGTFGQELPGIPADQMIPTGVTKRIIFLSENDDVRANVGCVNGAGIEVAVAIELYGSDGVQLETKYMMLPPYSNRQINGIFQDHAPINGYVDVRTSTPDALIYCYGSVLDNLTSDPTTVLPQ